jgi:hypothetical protein
MEQHFFALGVFASLRLPFLALNNGLIACVFVLFETLLFTQTSPWFLVVGGIAVDGS